MDNLEAALRVLNAINRRESPRAEDVAVLRDSPEWQALAPDEAACAVIEAELLARRTRVHGLARAAV
jgi:hypothetical protein